MGKMIRCYMHNHNQIQNFSKSREVLNSTEEKLKTATVELQKTHMDLMAKRSECQV